MSHFSIKAILIISLALGSLASIYLIGEEREPYTPGWVVIGCITTALMIWGIIVL